MAACQTALAGLEQGQAWEQWDCLEQALELTDQMATPVRIHQGWALDLCACRERALVLIRERALVLRRSRGWERFLPLGLVPNLKGEVGLFEAIFADLDTYSAPGMTTRCTCADA